MIRINELLNLNASQISAEIAISANLMQHPLIHWASLPDVQQVTHIGSVAVMEKWH